MVVYILRRLVYAVITLFLVSLLTFFIIELAPGSAVDSEIDRLRAMGSTVSTQQVEALEEQYGVNDPWIVKYGKWAGGLIQGDFGMSFAYREPVADVIWSRFGLSVALALSATIIAWGIAIPVGVYSATHRYSLGDNIVTLIQFIRGTFAAHTTLVYRWSDWLLFQADYQFISGAYQSLGFFRDRDQVAFRVTYQLN